VADLSDLLYHPYDKHPTTEKSASTDTEITTRLFDMASIFSMAQNAKFAVYLVLILVHEHLLHR